GAQGRAARRRVARPSCAPARIRHTWERKPRHDRARSARSVPGAARLATCFRPAAMAKVRSMSIALLALTGAAGACGPIEVDRRAEIDPIRGEDTGPLAPGDGTADPVDAGEPDAASPPPAEEDAGPAVSVWTETLD